MNTQEIIQNSNIKAADEDYLAHTFRVVEEQLFDNYGEDFATLCLDFEKRAYVKARLDYYIALRLGGNNPADWQWMIERDYRMFNGETKQ